MSGLLQTKHLSKLSNFEALIKNRRTIAGVNQVRETPPSKQLRLDFHDGTISQPSLDKLVVNFVNGGMQRFFIVENFSFVLLIRALSPKKTLLARKALISRRQEEYMEMKDRLKQELSNVAYVCITADCWTTFRRCYIGITLLWLLSRTLERRSAVLACRRLVERVTDDILAATISEVLEEYDLQTKVTRVITHNGSNFLKAFSIFGEKSFLGKEDEEIDIEGVDLSKLIDSADEGICLPQHHRCTAHCLNLVSTVDASCASEDEAFSKMFTVMLYCARFSTYDAPPFFLLIAPPLPTLSLSDNIL
ncbi:uncharacterized protein LOC120842902 [Ixodes scapularis]|uniref:uncharacterized protein LOC120842902 n=1 Tax=Ixodes scapularis TaxID=6945 RepID=UPI001C38C566|nr:uncharacterized protein LOC120842902 [Ixodes scapularis]